MSAAEFVDGTGPQLPTVGPRGGQSPAATRTGSEASTWPAPAPAPMDVTDAEGRQVRERSVRCSRCGVKTWNYSARCDRCEGLFAPMAILDPADFIDVLPAPSPRDDERSASNG